MEQNSNYRVLSNVCVSCGVRIPDIDFEIKPAMRETYGLFLVTAGKGIFIIDGIEYPVKRGNSVMLFPYSSISVKAYPNIMFEYKWVELTGFEIAVMISRTNFSKSRPVAPEIPVESLFQYFDVCDDNSDTVYAACRTNGKVLILLSYYIQYYPSRKSTETDYIMQARDYIERNFRQVSCTVKSVADKVQPGNAEAFFVYSIVIQRIICCNMRHSYDCIVFCNIPHMPEMKRIIARCHCNLLSI